MDPIARSSIAAMAPTTSPFRLCVVAAVAALCVDGTLAGVAKAPESSCRRTTVAILGGGMAGIAAAQALHNASVTDFVIVEYQNRIGGRAIDSQFGRRPDGSPYTIELGANWIQGLGNPGGPENPIWSLAKKHKLANTPSNYSSILTYDETGASDYGHLLEAYEAAARKMTVEAGRLLAENLQDQSARSGLSLAGWNPRHDDMAAQAVEYWSWDWETTVPPEVSSMIFGAAGNNLTFRQFSEDNNLVVDARGYRAIIEGEAATFLTANDTRLRLNGRVTSISHDEAGVVVRSDDGSCLSAAYALCTFSLGVLQHGDVEFAPALPTWKQRAVHKFSMGTYTKIFFQFDETFWPTDKEYFLYASPTTRGYWAQWQSLSTDGFLPGSNILFATVTGDESYRLEQLSDDEAKLEGLAVLRQMFPDRTVPEPTAFTYPRWTKTAWSRGSYSNWPVGTTLEMHQNLRANVGRLWFAGEATSAAYFGFLHGAWFEGREAGEQIAGLLRDGCGRSAEAAGERRCGARVHYETLHGTSPLASYNVLNGWATSSFYASKASAQ
ncbi:hypothetical protein RJ55_01984 [Drechmeria coniospora]|nr:hypothetical protein RJ55_01984 [Drechmeria coniospora]